MDYRYNQHSILSYVHFFPSLCSLLTATLLLLLLCNHSFSRHKLNWHFFLTRHLCVVCCVCVRVEFRWYSCSLLAMPVTSIPKTGSKFTSKKCCRARNAFRIWQGGWQAIFHWHFLIIRHFLLCDFVECKGKENITIEEKWMAIERRNGRKAFAMTIFVEIEAKWRNVVTKTQSDNSNQLPCSCSWWRVNK